MTGTAHIVRADAGRTPLRSGSVALICTSPPYPWLRLYEGAGPNQIGSEVSGEEYLRAMWKVADEMWRVLDPRGSAFINMGGKFAGAGGHNNAGVASSGSMVGSTLQGGKQGMLAKREADRERKVTRRTAPDRYVQGTEWARPKSAMMLPQAFVLGLINPRLYRDHIDPPTRPPHPIWILRAPMKWVYGEEVPAGESYLWKKPNSLPSSKTDAVNITHEDVFHLTKSERYFAAVDEIREPHADGAWAKGPRSSYQPGSASGSIGTNGQHEVKSDAGLPLHPLGRLPGSVWEIASEPLKLPTWRVVRAGRTAAWFLPRPAPKGSTRDMAYEDALKWMRAMGTAGGRPSLRKVAQHFAAWPSELVRKMILGWSPRAICTACGEGRSPVVGRTYEQIGKSTTGKGAKKDLKEPLGRRDGTGMNGKPALRIEATILGYACACPEPTSPTRPALVFDPFAGTGTTMLVAKALGRTGIGTELSHPYAKVAEWRLSSDQGTKAEQRTWRDAQGSLL